MSYAFCFLEAKGILHADQIESLKEKVRKKFLGKAFPSLQEITCAASLVHYGFLGSVRNLALRDVDILSIPIDHLAPLISSVYWSVDIQITSNVLMSHLVLFLDSLRQGK